MNTLFPEEFLLPKGFSYVPDFLTDSEEAFLLQLIRDISLKPLVFQGFEAKRKVSSFGLDYHFDARTVTKGTPIPEVFSFLLRKVSLQTRIPEEDFAEMLLTEYPPGAVINWHRDGPPFEVIVGISLLSDCVFRFRPYDKAKQQRSSLIRYSVARKSLYTIKEASREEWEHSILPVTTTRYSITLRTLKKQNLQ